MGTDMECEGSEAAPKSKTKQTSFIFLRVRILI